MPPQSTLQNQPPADTDHMLSPPGTSEHSSSHHGPNLWPIARTIIVILSLMLGGLYFWGAYLNSQDAGSVQPPAPVVNP